MIQRYIIPEIEKVWSKEYKFKLMLDIELLVLEALSRIGKIPPRVLRRIKKKASFNVGRIEEREKTTHHDVVAFVLEVSSHLGRDSSFFHWGLTSNDLLDTSLSLQLREALEIIIKDLHSLKREVKKKALKYKNTPCVARTHGVHAEVYSLGLKFLLFFDELERNGGLLEEAYKRICVGKLSGAVGTYAHLSPRIESYVLNRLRLKPAPISTQVIPRDRIAFLLSVLSILASCIERFSTEIRHLQRTEVSEVFEPFYRGQKGSSAMPHKRNPILCERLCGMARLLRSYLLASLENISLWHERDISHSSVERVILPDITNLIDYMLRKTEQIIKGLEVNIPNLWRNLELNRGIIYSQKVLLRLMEKGLPRPQAYDIIQDISLKISNKRAQLKEELLKDKRVNKYLTKKEIERIFNPRDYLRNIDNIYQRVLR